MSDLEGPELDLAVARVMGRPCMVGELVAGYPRTITCFSAANNGTTLLPWRPSRVGAEAWEVFCFGADRWGFLRFTSLMDSIMTAAAGSMDWAECACRAVVALGEAG